MHGDSGGIAVGGDIGRHSHVAWGWGAGHASRAGAVALLALEVNTLESEEGEFWTEGGKCGIDAERNQRTRSAAPGARS